jgi:hypothetical protein
MDCHRNQSSICSRPLKAQNGRERQRPARFIAAGVAHECVRVGKGMLSTSVARVIAAIVAPIVAAIRVLIIATIVVGPPALPAIARLFRAIALLPYLLRVRVPRRVAILVAAD